MKKPTLTSLLLKRFITDLQNNGFIGFCPHCNFREISRPIYGHLAGFYFHRFVFYIKSWSQYGTGAKSMSAKKLYTFREGQSFYLKN